MFSKAAGIKKAFNSAIVISIIPIIRMLSCSSQCVCRPAALPLHSCVRDPLDRGSLADNTSEHTVLSTLLL